MFLSACFLPLAFLILFTSQASAVYPDSAQAAALIETQRLTFADQFTEANAQAEGYATRWPGDPAGHLFQAAVLLAEMTDQEESRFPDIFKQLLDSAELLATKYPDSSATTRAWMQLWIGHARAYRSVWESRFGSLTAALRKGLGAKGEYEKGLRLDSTVYDLYAGLGSYHYWKSAKAGVLRWIGIFSNDKARGIRELQLAAERSRISRESSRAALIWIYADAEQYDSALALARDLHARYPSGKSFAWPMAQVFFAQKQYDSALVYYQSLRDRIFEAPGNYYNLLECDFYLARCYELLRQPAAMRQRAAQFLVYRSAIPEVTRRRQRGKISYLQEKSGEGRDF